jgi:hypothetical protein
MQNILNKSLYTHDVKYNITKRKLVCDIMNFRNNLFIYIHVIFNRIFFAHYIIKFKVHNSIREKSFYIESHCK